MKDERLLTMNNSASINPITCLDYPDPDVIRVGDTYYMVSTTMHFMPGCEILRSYDLQNWEHASYVYDYLDNTPAQRLENGQNIYGKGMWAASLRYHNGMFYICFVANDTHKTYLYTSTDINGPWAKNTIEGFYHDCSLLFDDDNRVYIVYGNTDIYITELNDQLTAPLEGGLHRLIISDKDNHILGYEGSHIYKINNHYYIFFIHSRPEGWRRVQCCFIADSLDGEWTGYEVLNDDLDYCGQGIAQGGIVDTPDGDWYAILFQDRGAVGRIPMLIPLKWQDNIPVLGTNGKVPESFPIMSTRPSYNYKPLVGSEDFRSSKLSPYWQFNHTPDWSLITHDTDNGKWTIKTDCLVTDMTQAKNTLTQRMLFPKCCGTVTLDPSNLGNGDYAGLGALQGNYGLLAVTNNDGCLNLVLCTRDSVSVIAPVHNRPIQLRISADFSHMRDTAFCAYKQDGDYITIPDTLKLVFDLNHFTGCRFSLVMYSTKETGGSASFSDFIYSTDHAGQ